MNEFESKFVRANWEHKGMKWDIVNEEIIDKTWQGTSSIFMTIMIFAAKMSCKLSKGCCKCYL